MYFKFRMPAVVPPWLPFFMHRTVCTSSVALNVVLSREAQNLWPTKFQSSISSTGESIGNQITAFKLLSPTLQSLSDRLATSKVSIALYRSGYFREDELLIHFRLLAVALRCRTSSLLSILSLSAMVQFTQRNSVICYYFFGDSFVLAS